MLFPAIRYGINATGLFIDLGFIEKGGNKVTPLIAVHCEPLPSKSKVSNESLLTDKPQILLLALNALYPLYKVTPSKIGDNGYPYMFIKGKAFVSDAKCYVWLSHISKQIKQKITEKMQNEKTIVSQR